MQKRWISMLALTALLAGMLVWAAPATSAPQPPMDRPTPAFVAGQILVSFEPATSLQERQAFLDAHRLKTLRQLDKLDASVIETPAGAERTAVEALRALPGVRYAELNYVAEAFGAPTDPAFNLQWNLRQINGPAAWDITTGSVNTIIAIVDTGIALSHPDLQAKIVAGYDFVNGDAVAQDDHGHGTHCAGIAAAASNNGVGVAGVNWQARLMPVKVLNSQGTGSYADVAAGIIWAADRGATVISLSLGGSAPSIILSNAVNYAYARGVIVVAAAGNSYANGNAPMYPAALDNVIAVAATTTTDARAYYSNAGAYVDLAAPGGDASGGIYSTLWSAGGHTYGAMIGTSMAAPHVAGLAALLKGVNSALTPQRVAELMQSTAVDLGATGRDDIFGWGRIDVLAAVQAAGNPVPTPTAAATRTPSPVPTATATPATYLLRVNCGGPKYIDQAGKVWQADRAYTPGSWGHVAGTTRTTTAGIAGTLDDDLYQSERLWSAGGRPAYRFTVPNGRYEVTLKFAETYWSAAGKRRFSVMLEGGIKLPNYDIFVAAGAKNKAAPDRVFLVDVNDGELTLDLIRALDMPKLNAIQVKKIL